MGNGLLKCVGELRECSPEEAAAIIDSWIDWSIPDVYRQLQEWCHPRQLVDKTPAYASDIRTLQRCLDLFPEGNFVHLTRHPYTTLKSMFELFTLLVVLFGDEIRAVHALTDFGGKGLEYQWEDVEKMYRTQHQNISVFMSQVPSGHGTKVMYEDLLADPEATLRALCGTLGVQYQHGMSDPYSADNRESFAGAKGLTIGDPKMLQQKKINRSSAQSWRKSQMPQALATSTAVISKNMGYVVDPPFPAEIRCLYRSERPDTAVFLLHDISGTVNGSFANLGVEYGAENGTSVYGFSLSPWLVHSAASVEDLSEYYLRILNRYFVSSGTTNIRLVGYSFGFRLAYRMASALEASPDLDVQVVSLDGPVFQPLLGPSKEVGELLSEMYKDEQVKENVSVLAEYANKYSTNLRVQCPIPLFKLLMPPQDAGLGFNSK